MARPMTQAEAADYAPQWGSYMTAADPGAVMYCGVDDPKARPLMAEHVRNVLIPECRERLAAGDTELEDDPPRLEALLSYLES